MHKINQFYLNLIYNEIQKIYLLLNRKVYKILIYEINLYYEAFENEFNKRMEPILKKGTNE